MEIRLAYASRAAAEVGPTEMRAIEDASLRNNPRLGVTGALYYDGEQFFQVLEGPENAVAVLFDQIRKDARHRDVTVVTRHPIDHRLFGLWSMKFVNGLNRPQLAATFRAAQTLSASEASGPGDPRIEALRVA